MGDENAGIDYETQRALEIQENNRLSLNASLTNTIVGGKLVAVLRAPCSPEERLSYDQRWRKLTTALEVLMLDWCCESSHFTLTRKNWSLPPHAYSSLHIGIQVCAAKYEMLAISPIYNNIYEAQVGVV